MDFSSFLTDFNIVLIAIGASFVSGVVFSTKVKDFVKGVPSQVRSAINNVETDALGKLKVAQAQVLATLPGAVTDKVAVAPAPAPTPAAPVAKAAPAAPAAPAPAITTGSISAAPAAPVAPKAA
jgi:hypothetical protein